ncbi:ankyrin repeat domain-containing protein [Streptomyces collinus]|uniref:ankyrin repeat domain-containing protein n=1 Tax=Streptomyces collinus TaxID=42684 RepID=UPI0033ECF402
MTTEDDGKRLAAAVRHGDAERVRELLDAGAGPDTLDERTGLSVLCSAIAARDEPVAEALVEHGADPLRRLPDGTTPLLRAVDTGSLWLVRAVLPELVRLPGPAREELLDHARHRALTAAEAELRRRTGLPGPAGRTRLEDAIGCWYEELTLGGQTLCDGNLAILTGLEAKLRLRTPFRELLARALTHPDRNRNHQTWSESVTALGDRLDDGTWAEAWDLSRDPDPVNRLFAADVLLALVVGAPATGRAQPFLGRARELMPWAERERDVEVLDVLLNTLTWAEDLETRGIGLRCATHPDPRIRSWAPELLDADAAGRLGPRSLAVLHGLVRDPDADVRARTCHWLAHHRGPEPEVGDALLELTHDERQLTRIHAVAGLAYRDDPRCVEAETRIGPVEPDLGEVEPPLLAVWYYQRRQEERAPDRHPTSDYPGRSIHPPGQE